ncbi:MAG: S-methyl-5'-thioadenosine phosphorylase [Gemmatimonadaceae bacterium]|nr:S-methyl-5'-thioadenosine phosphorylase [Gemmatimonadaceae bacterium]
MGLRPSTPQLTGVIGGSGVYDIDGLTGKLWVKIASPFGEPSDEILYGELDGLRMAFLPRHGRGHRIPPSEINFRANIDALKRAGVTDLISVSAVGSLREDLVPGTFVVVDQFIDRTFARQKSFFGNGMVAHVSMADPVCKRLGAHLMQASRDVSAKVVDGGTYLVIEGPQFSTRAESELYRQWGCDVIGMTNMPEAKLAREAEMCYASVAMVTDFDCWHLDHDEVTVDAIIKVLVANGDQARTLVKAVAPRLNRDSSSSMCRCKIALNDAVITAPGAREPLIVERLRAIAGRVLGSE